eukprot:6364742-Amphidinium_carterae.1
MPRVFKGGCLRPCKLPYLTCQDKPKSSAVTVQSMDEDSDTLCRETYQFNVEMFQGRCCWCSGRLASSVPSKLQKRPAAWVDSETAGLESS